MKNKKIVFISIVFILAVLVVLYDMSSQTKAPWRKKGGLNKYRNTIEVK